jgi:hypothetical protein
VNLPVSAVDMPLNDLMGKKVAFTGIVAGWSMTYGEPIMLEVAIADGRGGTVAVPALEAVIVDDSAPASSD